MQGLEQLGWSRQALERAQAGGDLGARDAVVRVDLERAVVAELDAGGYRGSGSPARK